MQGWIVIGAEVVLIHLVADNISRRGLDHFNLFVDQFDLDGEAGSNRWIEERSRYIVVVLRVVRSS
jgi:hypothetical protein